MLKSDLLIVGGGPAGLAAAINAASEGLSVRLLDNGDLLGGQAKESSAIENYPGFPDGITGPALMHNLVRQAVKFDCQFVCPTIAQRIERHGNELQVTTDDYQEFSAKAVLLTLGLQYRRLPAIGISSLLGRGVSYGMPTGRIPNNKPCTVAIVGGANSAGQAVLRLAQNKKAKIKLIIRKTIETQMSKYLITRIRAMENVEVIEGAEVVAVGSHQGKLTDLVLEYADKSVTQVLLQYMFIFIGANPKTLWLKGTIDLDKHNYILTGGDKPPYETSMRGVFAAGDVRSGSVKRISAASGEGSSVLNYIHKYLGELV